MKVHFIAIGGAAMHNLAIALHKKGYMVTGSDDEIFEPSRTRLGKYGLLPTSQGWNPENITSEIDVIILGMHALDDNPELIKARELGLKINSFPEFLYEQTKNKTRVVVGGSHGKTSITSMIMHVLKLHDKKFDYLVGSQIEGFETMVGLSEDSELAVFEGDEYLSSALDKRPKFHLYNPHIAIISGIAWDHFNVFPTFENYVDQFKIFIEKIEPGGKLFYDQTDETLVELTTKTNASITKTGYNAHPYINKKTGSFLINNKSEIPVKVFGDHNMKNLQAAKHACFECGISDDEFYEAITSFSGAARRLQLIHENASCKAFLDFAHSPSKVKATTEALKSKFPDKELIVCFELHTYSSLNKEFLPFYKGTLDKADKAIVVFNEKTVEHKRLEKLSPEFVKTCFAQKNIEIITNGDDLSLRLRSYKWQNKTLAFMSSGNFLGIHIDKFVKKIFE